MIIKYNNINFKETEFKNYFVSKCGEIVSIKIKGGQGLVDINKPRILCKKTDKDGYFEVCISMMENGVHARKYRRLHRLVYETWCGNIDDTIDHADGNKQNNNIKNLKPMSRADNARKARLKQKTYSIKYVDGTEKIISCLGMNELCKTLGVSEGLIRLRIKKETVSLKSDIVKITECND